MGSLTASLRRLVMMMVGFRVDLPALAAFDDHTMGIMMGHVDHKLGLACATAIRFVPAAFAHRRSGRVFKHVGTRRSFGRNEDHVELGHRLGLLFEGSELVFHTAHSAQKYQRQNLIGCAA